MNEADIIAHYEECRVAHEGAADALDDHFMPLMRAAVDKGDQEGLDALIARCPQSVTRAFLQDARRQLAAPQCDGCEKPATFRAFDRPWCSRECAGRKGPF